MFVDDILVGVVCRCGDVVMDVLIYGNFYFCLDFFCIEELEWVLYCDLLLW